MSFRGYEEHMDMIGMDDRDDDDDFYEFLRKEIDANNVNSVSADYDKTNFKDNPKYLRGDKKSNNKKSNNGDKKSNNKKFFIILSIAILFGYNLDNILLYCKNYFLIIVAILFGYNLDNILLFVRNKIN
jgi:hypothetical protein